MAKNDYSNASRNLGILSIVIGLLIPMAGIILGIIGLCVKKSKSYGRDVALSVTGIAVSMFAWIIYIFVFLGSLF